MCPLSAKSIPSKSTKLTPKDTKGQEIRSVRKASPHTKKPKQRAWGWGRVARCLATRPLTLVCREVCWDAEGRLQGFRQKAEAALRVVSAFLPKARSPASGLVNELPSLQKNTLL